MCACVRACACVCVRVFVGGGGAGASEGRVTSKFFTNWGGSNLFYWQPGYFYLGKVLNILCHKLFGDNIFI